MLLKVGNPGSLWKKPGFVADLRLSSRACINELDPAVEVELSHLPCSSLINHT